GPTDGVRAAAVPRPAAGGRDQWRRAPGGRRRRARRGTRLMRARHRADLTGRLDGLRKAVDTLDLLPDDDVDDSHGLRRAREVLANVGRRRELSAAHTVVALAGATGSGKSSLLNALTGVDVAEVAARRPTTSHPLAVLWSGTGVDSDAARPLLDWL